jgi:hypothetical protein
VTSSGGSPAIFSFSISTLPTTSCLVSLSFTPPLSNSLIFSPSQSYWLSSTSLSRTVTFQVSSFNTGSYNLSISPAISKQCPESATPGILALTVLPPGSFLPAPGLSSAIFSNDGSKIFLKFKADTDSAGTTRSFPKYIYKNLIKNSYVCFRVYFLISV